ncbi:LacI family DNA-binding transcriptional regulator [Paenibacillus sp. GD4]|uniref:LacI family DNA-binding transcriptional regulator n=1 Tax=Paenibacillus sp. GD4 TaxID=3068890 RepID=UPI002796A9D2|nr:LacI family DNA-binding transcriptional regulator [Paenibacillus sp. GD4]MDQ1911414.1 LacI family DNA-binding transcriptional regulator [Paenibacillus sp. GD4]
MAVTIKDIADLCGVSAGTVDRALNNRPGISSKTKSKILRVAEELNYKPDYMASSLARGRTMTIGVVLFDLHNRSFAQLMNAIESRCREKGYFVNLLLTGKDKENERKCIEHLVSRKVDGIILFTVNEGEEYDRFLQEQRVPIITICNRISDRWSYVGINDRQAMRDAVDYICSRGYEEFIYVCPPLAKKNESNIYTQEERLAGCLESLKENGVRREPLIITEKDYVSVLDSIDLRASGRTAIICSCDIYALEVLNHIKSKGLKLPEEVGVMGFDNIDVLKYVTPALSTVEYAVEEFGVRAVDALIHQLETGDLRPEPLLAYQIIQGESI